jgi:NSS family neurotransmitter:Na+ symporter
LEAVGHAFFSLSIGMGCMLAYGSYLKKGTNLVSTGVMIVGLDTGIALMACMVLFPITFANGMDPAGGPGLVFMNMPVALMALPGGVFWAILFFLLLFIAALTSAISLLEVAASYFIDDMGWSRTKATLTCAIVITAVGVPSALSGTGGMFTTFFGDGTSWFDGVDWAVSNVMLPLGGLGVALFVGWRMSGQLRREAFGSGSSALFYVSWLFLMQWIAPIAVIIVFLNAIGLVDIGGLFDSPTDPASAEIADPATTS